MKGIQFVPPGTSVDFIGQRFIAFAFSTLIVLGALFLLSTKGLNFGIDFTGGMLMEIQVETTDGNPPDLAAVREALNDLNLGDVTLQEFGSTNDLLIRLPGQPGGGEGQQAALNTLRGSLNGLFKSVEYRRTEFVGPQVGDELKRNAVYSVVFSLLGIMAYIWFRVEWQFGMGALIALAHDVIATIGFFAITGKPFDLTALAAVLMIAGYSINDTVVIFDRIRETMRKYKKKPLPEIFNLAINETLSRTFMTGISTLIALAALWFLAGEVIRSFVEALMFGIVFGTYSSVYVASAVLIYMRLRPNEEGGVAGEKTANP